MNHVNVVNTVDSLHTRKTVSNQCCFSCDESIENSLNHVNTLNEVEGLQTVKNFQISPASNTVKILRSDSIILDESR